jgi:putative ABC transport system permease protein
MNCSRKSPRATHEQTATAARASPQLYGSSQTTTRRARRTGTRASFSTSLLGGDEVSSVIVGLAPDAVPGDVDDFARRRIDLELSAIHEPAYYASQSAFYRPIRVMVLASAALVAAGALLGGLNTMFAAFASRIRELAMLQVLGFGRIAVAVSMLQESLIASTSGALLAVVAAIALLDGFSVRFSMGTFGIRIDEAVVAIGIGAGALVGIAGCILPAVRCLRIPITVALKSE